MGDHEPVARPYAVWLAALVPFCVYACSTGASSYWLDSGEFTAGAIHLDITHPPGHPLASLWGRFFTLLPLGPLPFRVALGQAVATALALAALCVAFARTLSLVGLGARLARELLALSGTWLLASSYAFWFQSVRQEVYALQALFVCVSLERLTRAAQLFDTAPAGSPERSDPRPFYVATLALGVGLANHHFISVLGVPALLYELARLTRRHGIRPWAVGLGLALLGLVGYAYLPLRASTLPPMDLGHPVTARDLAWVMSAQVYARRVGFSALQPLDERLLDLLVLVIENLSWPVVVLALLGAYDLVRVARLRALGWLWGVTALVSLVGRAYLNEVRNNPDVLGYMMPGFAALVALALAGVAAVLGALSSRHARLVTGCAVVALVLAPLGFWHQWPRTSLAEFHATDDFDTLRRRALPADALLVLVTPETAFRHWDGEAVERLRPDVTLLPLPFVGYGGSAALLGARHPELAGLIGTYLEHDRLDLVALQRLGARRPLLVEADVSETLPLYPYLLPEGLLYRLAPAQPKLALVRLLGQERTATHRQLLRTLGAQLEDDETRRKLLWILYTDALYFAFHGALELAAASTRLGLELAPQTQQLVALEAALARAPAGPLDIRPFLLRSR
jgi:hypothetical protein